MGSYNQVIQSYVQKARVLGIDIHVHNLDNEGKDICYIAHKSELDHIVLIPDETESIHNITIIDNLKSIHNITIIDNLIGNTKVIGGSV